LSHILTIVKLLSIKRVVLTVPIYSLTINLLSDPDSKVQEKYGVWRKKKFMGREYIGTVRTTLLIDKSLTIVKIWDKVKVKGHAKEVLNSIPD
jgi:peroxiredoxin Q/BCP